MFDNFNTQQPKSVGLAGDGDDVDVLKAFEEVFELAISDEEANSMLTTLGDAFEIIVSKLPNDPDQHRKCLTAMAYYRLNRALGGQGKIHPDTVIEIPEGMTSREFLKQIEDRSGFNLGDLTYFSTGGDVLAVLRFVTWIIGPVLFDGWVAALVGIGFFAISHALYRFADRLEDRVLDREYTLGDMTRSAVDANIGKLIASGGKWSDADIWKAMTWAIHCCTGFPRDEMTPDMRFV